MVERDTTISQQEFMAMPGDDAALLIGARFDELRERGCDAEAAVVLAVHPQINIEAATDLLELGCDPRTVLRILL